MTAGRGWRVAGIALAACAALTGCRRSAGLRNDPGAVAGGPPPATALILSGKGTVVYHFCACAYARDIPAKEQIGFDNPVAAERAGRIPCAACRPREAFEAHGREAPSPAAPSVSAPGVNP